MEIKNYEFSSLDFKIGGKTYELGISYNPSELSYWGNGQVKIPYKVILRDSSGLITNKFYDDFNSEFIPCREIVERYLHYHDIWRTEDSTSRKRMRIKLKENINSFNEYYISKKDYNIYKKTEEGKFKKSSSSKIVEYGYPNFSFYSNIVIPKHVFIAVAFIPNPDLNSFQIVNHLEEKLTKKRPKSLIKNYRPENLCWINNSGNSSDRFKKGYYNDFCYFYNNTFFKKEDLIIKLDINEYYLKEIISKGYFIDENKNQIFQFTLEAKKEYDNLIKINPGLLHSLFWKFKEVNLIERSKSTKINPLGFILSGKGYISTGTPKEGYTKMDRKFFDNHTLAKVILDSHSLISPYYYFGDLENNTTSMTTDHINNDSGFDCIFNLNYLSREDNRAKESFSRTEKNLLILKEIDHPELLTEEEIKNILKMIDTYSFLNLFRYLNINNKNIFKRKSTFNHKTKGLQELIKSSERRENLIYGSYITFSENLRNHLIDFINNNNINTRLTLYNDIVLELIIPLSERFNFISPTKEDLLEEMKTSLYKYLCFNLKDTEYLVGSKKTNYKDGLFLNMIYSIVISDLLIYLENNHIEIYNYIEDTKDLFGINFLKNKKNFSKKSKSSESYYSKYNLSKSKFRLLSGRYDSRLSLNENITIFKKLGVNKINVIRFYNYIVDSNLESCFPIFNEPEIFRYFDELVKTNDYQFLLKNKKSNIYDLFMFYLFVKKDNDQICREIFKGVNIPTIPTLNKCIEYNFLILIDQNKFLYARCSNKKIKEKFELNILNYFI